MEFTAVVTADATVKTTKNDKQLVSFSVVINDDYKTKTGEKKEQRTFVNCAFWRNTGIAAFLKKGSVVTVSGRMGINAYKKADGEYNASLSFTTEAIKIIATPRKAGGAAQATTQTATGIAAPVDDLPF